MDIPHLGEFSALLTAVFWTVTALAFESAGKRVGALSVNLIRLIIAFFIIGFYTWFSRGEFLPLDATNDAWFWLLISGFVGFVFGDLCLFRSFVIIGARISMLIMSLAPIIAGVVGYFFINEKMDSIQISGMIVTIIGVCIVIMKKKPGEKRELNYPIQGILLAFGGTVGQALGMVLSKHGMKDYDAFASTHIRIIAGVIGFTVIFFFMKRWKNFFQALNHGKAMRSITLGAFFGPFLGVSFSLLAVQYTSTGVALTIMSIVPILIILPSILIFKEKVTLREIVGAVITVVGVGMFFV